jgi:hypothetical protein
MTIVINPRYNGFHTHHKGFSDQWQPFFSSAAMMI